MHRIEVGKLYIEGRTSWSEAIEWNWASDVNELRMFFRNPQLQEVQSVKTGKIEFGLVREQDIIFLVFRILGAQKGQAGIPWSDAPYTYHMLPQDRRKLPNENLTPDERSLLQVVMVNANTGITLVIRMVSFSHEFTERMYKEIRDQAGKPFNQAVYDQQLQRVYTQYESKQLLDRAVVRCVGGQ